MKRNIQFLAILVLAAFAAAGCGKKADAHKPIEQVQAEAQKMSASDLQSTAQAYAKEITAKKSELNKVTDELKKLSPKDLLSEKAKSIKERISSVSNDAGELSKRYEIYARELQQKGGDLSKIKIEQ